MQERIIKQSYGCKPQQLALLTHPNILVVVAGRRSGKTTQINAKRSYRLLHSMPRSIINLYSHTYQYLLLNNLRELIYGWNQLGFREYDKKTRTGHYVLREPPPAHWPRPYRIPVKWDFSITCYNGTVFQLLSEDVWNNGGSAQAIMADEARKLNKEKYDQTVLAMSDDRYFKGNCDYMSQTLTTDQPVSATEQWIFEYEKMMDHDQLQLIQQLQIMVDSMVLEYYSEGTPESQKLKLQAKINKYTADLNMIRQDSTMFLEYSTLDNYYAIGEKFLMQAKKILPVMTYNISILNKRYSKPPNSFYPNFDTRKHSYTRFNYGYLGGLKLNYKEGFEPDCLQDGDINPEQPIDIALDCGGSINVLACGQDHGNEYRVLKGMHVKPPDKVKALAKAFAKYYYPHKTKKVYLIADPTDVPENAVSDVVPLYEFVNALEKEGWEVEIDYVGVVPGYMLRFNFINTALAETDERIPKIKLNKTHCDDMIISIEGAEMKEGKTGWEKEKKYEKRKDIPQEKTTHYSDAFDKLVYHKLKSRINDLSFFDSVYS